MNTENYYKEVVKRVGAYFMDPGIYSVCKDCSKGNQLINRAYTMWELLDSSDRDTIEKMSVELHELLNPLRVAFIRAMDEDGF